MASSSPLRYRWRGGAILRATTDPGDLGLPGDLDLCGDAGAARARGWLGQVWRREDVRDALSAASPVLCRQVDAVLADASCGARQLRRTVLSVASYLLRWQRRPTPFALFAGVAAARIGSVPRASWGTGHTAFVRPDAEWLADVIGCLEQHPDLLRRLPVVVNDAGRMRGGRFVVPGAPADGRAHLLAPLEVSVGVTRPVCAVLDAARAPIPYDDLRSLLVSRFPAAAPQQVDSVLRGLITQNMLITSLWPPMTHLDGLGHLCRELEAAGAETVGAVADLVRRLYEIRDGLADQDPTAAWSARAGLIERMNAVSTVTPVPLIVDTALDCDIEIPEQVVQEAQEAACVMYRLTPQPFGYQQWRDYHRAFRARYGTGALVPVLDLVADSGLGLPADYQGAALGRPPRQVTERDEKLLALIQQALLERREEIVLTKEVIADLALGQDAELIPVPRVEIAVEIHAASLEALARGAFRLVVTGAPRPGASMAGRFTHLLPEPDQAAVAATYETADPGVVAAQLSFAPRRRRTENIIRTRQVLPHVIPVSEHRADTDGVIGLADLAVTADARAFQLVQMSTGRLVEPRVAHALEAGVHTPALARFLAEITTARSAAYKGFDFGAAVHLPYLPRVRYRSTVLSPARWMLRSQDLPSHGAATTEWDKALTAWRGRLRVPERVTVVDDDQRLPLDLDHSLHRMMLRRSLDAAGRLELGEAPAPDAVAWLGRPHELLLPLTLETPLAPRRPTGPLRRVAGDAAQLPGRGQVLAVHLSAHPARYDEILTHHLPSWLDPAERWWFRRHRDLARPDADQYLALYLSLPHPDAYGQVARRVSDWAAELRRRHLASHLALATYEPQTGRYGHGAAMDAAHIVFVADSAAALAQIRLAEKAGVPAQALAAAGMVDLAARFAASPTQGLHWLVENLPREHGPLDQALRDQTLALADPYEPSAGVRELPGGGDLAAAWQTRASALAAYREHLKVERDPLTVLRSLLHQHHVRSLSVDPDDERATGRLVRACALRHTSRRDGVR
ncbi:lantibiotic dehydratase [Peterkaempfera bronchialis]|uniref:Lantibiotic dehydratase n=1 Tax=Peterkaempfera bronchialis TaxID=2126346 RepID=A0A345SUR5_9ACTN|nr:lantibiotic dehydratase [Peterkaempfera bronchialis]AXI77470.1 lantibiotic dehydratase [Peterkaempfera bronchialis]